MSTKLVDMLGRTFVVGDKVAKAYQSGRSVNMSLCVVTKLTEDRVYLDNSKVPVRFPGRTLIVTDLFQPKVGRIERIAE